MNHRIALALLFPMLLPVVVAPAEEIALGTAPSNPAQAGFRMVMSTARLGNEGFRPVKLVFSPIRKQFGRQRELTILFRPRTQYERELDFQFSCDVTVPQGVNRFEKTVMVPQFHRWESCWVRVIEDGRPCGKVPTRMGINNSVKDWGQQVSFAIIVPRDSRTVGEPWAVFPDVRSMVTVFGDGPIDQQPKLKRFTDKQARSYVDKLSYGFTRFRILDEPELPETWIGYSQLDVVLAPYPVLARIAEEQPAAFEQLRKWVSTGGQVWAYAAPPQLAANDPVLGGAKPEKKGIRFITNPAPRLGLGNENDTAAVEFQPWSDSYSGSYSYNAMGTSRKSVYDDLVDAENPMVEVIKRKEFLSQLSTADHGLGRIVLIAADDPFPGSFQFWSSLEIDYQQWNTRQGVDFTNGNDSYWSWLMAAVGGPPVKMFIALNTLFVIVMGPVLYFMLRRKRRLYLLYFLAPTLAFLATVGLFVYAFLSDGFDNRARVRQLTWVDARGNPESCPIVNQSRHTYYTIVDSRQGLHFDAEDMVFPVLHTELVQRNTYYMASDNRAGDYLIRRTPEGRHYGGDFLPTRTQVQYLVSRPETGPCPIEVDWNAKPFTVTNRLQTTLDHVAVCDGQGKFWIANSVAAGAKADIGKRAK